ncbi:MAG TPA: hypothetical protein VJB94_01495 [Candidatus Nanoarchaeia archaeon]|nr:hypothetical protein [Candidatus Nanoarchaeia archaeon]
MENLTIDNLTSQEFKKLVTTGFFSETLSDLTLKEIRRLFDIGKGNTGRLACDEAHAHSYNCIEFSDRKVAVVYRLLEEIQKYRADMEEIKKRTSRYI